MSGNRWDTVETLGGVMRRERSLEGDEESSLLIVNSHDTAIKGIKTVVRVEGLHCPHKKKRMQDLFGVCVRTWVISQQ